MILLLIAARENAIFAEASVQSLDVEVLIMKAPAASKPTAPPANGDGGDRHRPTKSLPTERIIVAKHFQILRAYAIKSGQERRSVRVAEVAEIVGMVTATVSLVNPFFVECGLLTKTSDGFAPSGDVFNYVRTLDFSPDNPQVALTKLATTMRRSWVGERLIPKLLFRPLMMDDAIADLAEAVSASAHYRPNLEACVQYLAAVGLVTIDESGLVAPTAIASGIERVIEPAPPLPPPPKNQVETPPPPDKTKVVHQENAAGAVSFSVNVSIDMKELATWPADRIASLFSGIAQVVAAKKGLPEA
jgi:hypothetical protein